MSVQKKCSVQASFAHQKYYSSKKNIYRFLRDGQTLLISQTVSALRHRSYCPCMLAAIAGPWLCIGGAVYTKTPIAQPLTDYLCIQAAPAPKLTSGKYSVAFRLPSIRFGTLHASIPSQGETIEEQNKDEQDEHKRNENQEDKDEENKAEGHYGFPYICEYNGLTFSYLEKLGGEYTDKVVFKVKEGNKFRAVKFTTQYDEAAHRLLAGTNDKLLHLPHIMSVQQSTAYCE